LSPPLRFEDASFDAWIDKGFVDAVFPKETGAENKIQGRKLFDEANRMLSQSGTCIVVSLAEEHSLDLILQNWMEERKPWNACLHVWELHPVSGEMLPFGFVLSSKDPDAASNDFTVKWHELDGTVLPLSFDDQSYKAIFQDLTKGIESARRAYTDRITKQLETHQVLATIEIKPYDADVDMQALGLKIISENWATDASNDEEKKLLSPSWRSFSDNADDECSFVKVVEIGYGISKALLRCVIDSTTLDDLVETIEAWEGDEAFEGIQSVDVDWENTVPISAAANMFLAKLE
jgi:translation elongation factor EF-1beta